MALQIPNPPADARLDERDGVLHVADAGGEPIMTLRVDDGLVFARISTEGGADSRSSGASGAAPWEEVALPSVLALFADNTAVATWLRRAGANVLRLAMADLGASFANGTAS